MTAWDRTWERVHQLQQWGKYPPEELIRFVASNYYRVPNRADVKILDLGCGSGAASWFVAREGFSIVGIDGSYAAIQSARDRFANEQLAGTFHVGDGAMLPYRDSYFDAVVDIAAIQHNTISDACRIVGEISRVLRPGGRLFSMLIAAGSYGDGMGTEDESGTRTGIEQGPFAGKGRVRFYTERDVGIVFAGMQITETELSSRTVQGRKWTLAQWIVTAMKR